jgi:hypothetical protein
MPLVLTNATDPAALAIKALATSITEDKLPKTSRTLNVKLN